MPKQIWDLKRKDPINTRAHGRCIFLGFLDDGLECEVIPIADFTPAKWDAGWRPARIVIPTSEIVFEPNSQEAPQQEIHPVSRQLQHE